jgi:hypothetical protein
MAFVMVVQNIRGAVSSTVRRHRLTWAKTIARERYPSREIWTSNLTTLPREHRLPWTMTSNDALERGLRDSTLQDAPLDQMTVDDAVMLASVAGRAQVSVWKRGARAAAA